MYCNGLVTIMWQLEVSIDDSLPASKKINLAKKPGSDMRIVSPYLAVNNMKSFKCNEKSRQHNPTYVARCFLFCKCRGHWHCHYLQI